MSILSKTRARSSSCFITTQPNQHNSAIHMHRSSANRSSIKLLIISTPASIDRCARDMCSIKLQSSTKLCCSSDLFEHS